MQMNASAFRNICSTCATEWGIFSQISEKDERRVKMTAGVNRCSELVRRELYQGSLFCSPQSAMLILLYEQQEGC